MYIFLDEPLIIFCEPKKASHLSHISGHWPLVDGFHLLGIGLYTIFIYNMAQIDQFLPEKFTFFDGLSFNPTCLRFKHSPQSKYMFFWCFGENNDIIKINNTVV